MKITERDREDEEWRRLVEDFEWLEDHCWPRRDLTITLPKKRDKSAPFKLSEMIDLAVKMAEGDALHMVAMKVRQVAALGRHRAKLVHLLKAHAWDLAARQVPPGHA
jgi:hypothetical protein